MADQWGIPEGSTFEDEFNRNFKAMFGEPANPDWVDPNPPKQGQPTGGGGGGGKSAEDLYWEARAAQEAADAASYRAEQRVNAVNFLRDTLSMYGMGDLADTVEKLVTDWGTNTSVIANNLRQTDSYKTRFKGLLALQQKGITDVTNEGDYIRLESDYRKVFRDAGLQDFLGTAGSRVEQDAIAKLAADYSVSVNEVQSRVADAARVAQSTSPAVRDALQRYYNVAPSQIVEYMLDPVKTSAKINQQANAALVGGLAAAASLDVGRTAAEQYAALAGDSDMDINAATQKIGDVRQVRDATARLANIEGDTLSDDETLLAETGVDTGAQRKVKGLQSRERARFAQSSGFGQGSLSRGTGF